MIYQTEAEIRAIVEQAMPGSTSRIDGAILRRPVTPIRVLSMQRTCGACPPTAPGMTDDQRSVYVRYRGGCGALSLSEPGGSVDDAIDSSIRIDGPVLEWEGEHWLDGYLDYEKLREISRSVGVSLPEREDGTPD
jgi:hypothetical protein